MDTKLRVASNKIILEYGQAGSLTWMANADAKRGRQARTPSEDAKRRRQAQTPSADAKRRCQAKVNVKYES